MGTHVRCQFSSEDLLNHRGWKTYYIKTKLWNIITYPCPKFYDTYTTSPVNLLVGTDFKCIKILMITFAKQFLWLYEDRITSNTIIAFVYWYETFQPPHGCQHITLFTTATKQETLCNARAWSLFMAEQGPRQWWTTFICNIFSPWLRPWNIYIYVYI